MEDWFNDDPFENIIREFLGRDISSNKKRRDFIVGEQEDRNIDFVEDQDYVYLIFEVKGYTEKDIDVSIKGNILQIQASKKGSTCSAEKVRDYLTQKLCNGITIQKVLPSYINPKGFKQSIKNGVLEIIFNKK